MTPLESAIQLGGGYIIPEIIVIPALTTVQLFDRHPQRSTVILHAPGAANLMIVWIDDTVGTGRGFVVDQTSGTLIVDTDRYGVMPTYPWFARNTAAGANNLMIVQVFKPQMERMVIRETPRQTQQSDGRSDIRGTVAREPKKSGINPFLTAYREILHSIRRTRRP